MIASLSKSESRWMVWSFTLASPWQFECSHNDEYIFGIIFVTVVNIISLVCIHKAKLKIIGSPIMLSNFQALYCLYYINCLIRVYCCRYCRSFYNIKWLAKLCENIQNVFKVHSLQFNLHRLHFNTFLLLFPEWISCR